MSNLFCELLFHQVHNHPENGLRRRHHCVNDPEVLQFLHQPNRTSAAADRAPWEWNPAGTIQAEHGGMREPAPSVVWNGATVHVVLDGLSASSLLFQTRSCWRLQIDLTLPIGTCNWTRRRSKWSWVTNEHGSNWRRLLQTGRGPWRYTSTPGFDILSCDLCHIQAH